LAAAGLAGYVILRNRRRHSIECVLAETRQSFTITPEQLRKVQASFQAEMVEGLRAAENKSALKMIPTFVTQIPTGQEKGSFYALDLGGTNFRVLKVKIDAGKTSTELMKKFTIPPDLMRSSGTALFDFISEAIVDFVREELKSSVPDATRHVGFTFSFPVKQTGIASGQLITWTKGFSATGVEGQDVVALLNAALQRRGDIVKNVRIAALANDTVGTWAAAAFSDPSTSIGIILGTGSNACYVEHIEQVPKWQAPAPKSGKMIINIEWGAFDSHKCTALPYTPYDDELDKQSLHPGEQRYEKMLSGMYLGEITRLVLKSLVEAGALLPANRHERWRGVFSEPKSFATALMSQIAADKSPQLDVVNTILEEQKIFGSSLADRKIVQEISHLVAARAASLTAAGIAAILQHTRRLGSNSTVAIDGSVYELYPGFHPLIQAALEELLGSPTASKINIVLSKDGSGVGAALIAALAASE